VLPWLREREEAKMSARGDENKLIEAWKKIPVPERRRQLDELLSIVDADDEDILRMVQEGGAVTEVTSVRRITELRGLGKEVWQGSDAQNYVNEERESWH
jgi:hypothetical protein